MTRSDSAARCRIVVIEAVAVAGAVRPDAVFRGGRKVVPDGQVVRQVLDFRAVARLGLLGPLGDSVEHVAVRGGKQSDLRFRPRRLETVEAKVVAASLHVGGVEGDAQRILQCGQVLVVDLVLQVAGAGRDHDPLAAQDRGHQVGERLAGAGARFGEQDPVRPKQVRHRGSHPALARPGFEAGKGAGQRSVVGQRLGHARRQIGGGSGARGSRGIAGSGFEVGIGLEIAIDLDLELRLRPGVLLGVGVRFDRQLPLGLVAGVGYRGNLWHSASTSVRTMRAVALVLGVGEHAANQLRHRFHLRFSHASGRECGRPQPDAACHHRRLLVERDRVLVHRDSGAAERFLRHLPGQTARMDVDQQQMVVGAAADNPECPALRARPPGGPRCGPPAAGSPRMPVPRLP